MMLVIRTGPDGHQASRMTEPCSSHKALRLHLGWAVLAWGGEGDQ